MYMMHMYIIMSKVERETSLFKPEIISFHSPNCRNMGKTAATAAMGTSKDSLAMVQLAV